jgi:hypothetical protein
MARLTVALLDAIAVPVRQALKLTADDLPLAKVLEGGTWAAGRRIARRRGSAACRRYGDQRRHGVLTSVTGGTLLLAPGQEQNNDKNKV